MDSWEKKEKGYKQTPDKQIYGFFAVKISG